MLDEVLTSEWQLKEEAYTKSPEYLIKKENEALWELNQALIKLNEALQRKLIDCE